MYSFIVIISLTNKYRKHKSSMLNRVLPIDKMIIIQTFTMARWQIVVKTSEATKQTNLNGFGFSSAGVSIVSGYKRNAA